MTPSVLLKNNCKMNLKTASWFGSVQGMGEQPSLYISCLPFSALAWDPCCFPLRYESKALNLTILTGYTLNKIESDRHNWLWNLTCVFYVLIAMCYSRKGIDSEVRQTCVKALALMFISHHKRWSWSKLLNILKLHKPQL